MNWSNLPAHILENIFYHATPRVKRYKLNNEWFDSIQNLEKVCIGWHNVIFTSTSLFSNKDCILTCSHREIDRVERLAKAGYLRVVKNIRICSPEAVKRIRDFIEGNSFDHIFLETGIIGHGAVGYCYDWTGDNLELLLDFLSFCLKVKSLHFRFLIDNQQTMVSFWRLLIKQIHCNPYPKRIELELYFEDFLRSKLDWSFVKEFDCTGPGSIQEFKFVESEMKDTDADEKIGRLDWTYLTNAVSIDRLTVLFYDKSDDKGTSSLEFVKPMMNNLKTLCIQVDTVTERMINFVQNIAHPNVHLIIDQSGWHTSNYSTLKKKLIKKSSLIKNLQKSSSFKTLTCPSIKVLTCPSYKYNSNTQITFVMNDDSFLNNWNEYIIALEQSPP